MLETGLCNSRTESDSARRTRDPAWQQAPCRTLSGGPRLGDEPVPEAPNCRLLQGLGRADGVIGELRRPLHGNGLDQPAIAQVVIGIDVPDERDSLSGSC